MTTEQESIEQLLPQVTSSTIEVVPGKDADGWCSWCFEKTPHKLIEQNFLRRNVYNCTKCDKRTLMCRLCDSMARGHASFDWDDELCAKCNGLISKWGDLPDGSVVRGHCSWCFNFTSHSLIQKNVIRRDVYNCQCGKRTLYCRLCTSSFAKGHDHYDEEWCAKCDGTFQEWSQLTEKQKEKLRVGNAIAEGAGIRFIPITVGGCLSTTASSDAASDTTFQDQIERYKSIQLTEQDLEHPLIVESDFEWFLNEITTNDEYDVITNTEKIKVHRKIIKDSPVNRIKANFDIDDISPDIAANLIVEPELRVKWDTVIGEYKVIDTVNDNDVIYFSVNMPMGIYNRDFVEYRVCKYDRERHNYIIVYKHATHPACPERKNFVRAITYISGYVIGPVEGFPNRTSVTYIAQNDLKGSIPKYIINWVAPIAPVQWYDKFTATCSKYKQTSDLSTISK